MVSRAEEQTLAAVDADGVAGAAEASAGESTGDGSLSTPRAANAAKTARKFEYLTVNPCKMCMPMGSITAAYGLRRAMNLLHGSQGCSTYIRRHMATHFNEPIDIASSSLTEQGTVYGGEKSLHAGLDNLIRLYEPEIIVVSTTCLAETIGEDVEQMLTRWQEKHPESDVHLIPVATPGYGATQFEGFFRLLRATVNSVAMDETPHEGINVVTGPISPADTRWLLDVFERLNLDVCLLPDASDNLDGGFEESYRRLPQHGTSLEQIRRMAGARATIELSSFVRDEDSVAAFLMQRHGVPAYRLCLPMGLAATDEFFAVLRKLAKPNGAAADVGAAANVGDTAGAPPIFSSTSAAFRRFEKQRARYLDALIDCHKYAAQCRAVIAGEPDFVVAATRMCTEVGIFPVVVATGSPCKTLRDVLTPEVEAVAASHIAEFFTAGDATALGSTEAAAAAETETRPVSKRFSILDNADFNDIETAARLHGANVMLGSSDARRVAHKLHLPLVRAAFPIHDHMGGQRVRTLGYEGSLTLIDALVNHIIEHTETSFRDDLRQKYA
jgi:nitrogenase molybdenum-iron protein alpha/beta subunit